MYVWSNFSIPLTVFGGVIIFLFYFSHSDRYVAIANCSLIHISLIKLSLEINLGRPLYYVEPSNLLNDNVLCLFWLIWLLLPVFENFSLQIACMYCKAEISFRFLWSDYKCVLIFVFTCSLLLYRNNIDFCVDILACDFVETSF